MISSPSHINGLSPHEVFVFGSNLCGEHLGGAAHIAWHSFGAEMYSPVGHFGQSYAIPTIGRDWRPLSVVEISAHVDGFLAYAKANQHRIFLVTPIGCGIAGHKADDIAPLFKAAMGSENVRLPKEFIAILEGS